MDSRSSIIQTPDGATVGFDNGGNFGRFNVLAVADALAIRVFPENRTPTDADFAIPMDGIICLVNNPSGTDKLYIRLGGVWKSTNFT